MKEALTIVAITIGIISYVPYFIGIFKKTVKPHPLWILTNNPLWSVIIITVIDALAFFPTFRKSWKEPTTEPAITYALSSLKFLIAIFALEAITATTLLYPFSLVIMNAAFVIMLMYRKMTLT